MNLRREDYETEEGDFGCNLYLIIDGRERKVARVEAQRGEDGNYNCFFRCFEKRDKKWKKISEKSMSERYASEIINSVVEGLEKEYEKVVLAREQLTL